jgi:hypothetical protein
MHDVLYLIILQKDVSMRLILFPINDTYRVILMTIVSHSPRCGVILMTPEV